MNAPERHPPTLLRVLVPLAALALLVAALLLGGWVIPVTVVALLALAPALLAWWRRAETGIVGVEEPPPEVGATDAR